MKQHRRRHDAIGPLALTGSTFSVYLPPRTSNEIAHQRTVWLGASIDPILVRAVIPTAIRVTEPMETAVAWDPNCEVVQYIDRWHGSRDVPAMLGDASPETAARAQAQLDAVIGAVCAHADELGVRRDEIGIITHRGLEEHLRERLGTAYSTHFGAVHSSNSMENLRLLAIVGTYMPPLDDVRRLAAAIWGDLRIDEVAHQHSYVPFPGSRLSARVRGFAGERPQRLLQAVREEEMYQAVHRLRPHLSDVQARRILVFSSLPLPKVPATTHFLDATKQERIDRITACAEIYQAACKSGDEPSQAAVLRQARVNGIPISTDQGKALWEAIRHAAGVGTDDDTTHVTEAAGAVGGAGIRDVRPPRLADPAALTGLAATNAGRSDEAYARALAAERRLDERGAAVDVRSLASELGIARQTAAANKGIKRLLAERSAREALSQDTTPIAIDDAGIPHLAASA